MGIGTRLGTLAIAAALLFVALRFHGASGKPWKVTGVVLSFLAGCAFLVTFVGGWIGSKATSWSAGIAVAVLIACVGIIVVDVAINKRPDKPAFWAAFALSMAVVFGVAQIPAASRQVGDGASQVGQEIENSVNRGGSGAGQPAGSR